MSDNVFYRYNCPAKMNDGRYLTDYHTHTALDEFYQGVLQAKDPTDYRKKLQANAEKVADEQLVYLLKTQTCRCESTCKL